MTTHPHPEDYDEVVAASDRANRRFWRRDLIGYALLLLLALAAAVFLPRAEHSGRPHPSAIEAPSADQTRASQP